jgi:hypothetical protein
MRFSFCAFLAFLFSSPLFGACAPFSEALTHIGEVGCITGRVFVYNRGFAACIIWISVKTTACAPSRLSFFLTT